MSEIDVLPNFPDDDSNKLIEIEASTLKFGPRHVKLGWVNRRGRMQATEIVHLVGIPGNWRFDHVARLRSPDSRRQNQFFSLGTFSRAQRDRIIELATQIQFPPTSTSITCRMWMHELLGAMVEDDVVQLSPDLFKMVDSGVPLIARVPEA